MLQNIHRCSIEMTSKLPILNKRHHVCNKSLIRKHQLAHLLVFTIIFFITTSLHGSSATALAYNRQNHVSEANGDSSAGNRLVLVPEFHNEFYLESSVPPSSNNDVYSIADSQAMTDDYMVQFNNNRQLKQQEQQQSPSLTSFSTSTSSQYHHTMSGDNTLIVNHQQLSSCQTVCACKWKSGKQTVECIDRLLIQIPDNIDPSTQVLDMSGNKLQTLSNEQFIRANLLNLQKLYLRNCKIGEIEANTFKGLTNLVELDLSHNLLVVVPSLALSHVASLRELTIASNHIHKIESKAFRNTLALHKLDLSHCDIQTIAPQAFSGLEGLTLLRLNGNKLSELVPKTIETLSRLHGIELHDNPWVCDCRMRDAKLWLMEKNIPYPVAPVCAGGPERIVDRTFADLQIEDFACRPEMLPTSHFVDATMGENASIVCRAKAVPSAIIQWYWSGRLLSNNSVFSAYQRVHMYEESTLQFEKRSRLVLTNAQETDSSEFYCVAENKAGVAEANFTLHVSVRAAGMASLGSSEIVGLSAALFVIILLVLLMVMFLLVRVKRQPYVENKTANHLEIITSVNHQNTITNKTQAPSGNGSIGGIVIANGSIPNNCLENCDSSSMDRKIQSATSTGSESKKFANLVQKPPRITDLPYSTSGYDSAGSILSTAPCFISPTTSTGNNPDLINDTKRFDSDEFEDLKIPVVLSAEMNNSHIGGDGPSGEYSRAGGCDSLYPSGLWTEHHAPSGTSSADDLFLKHFTDKTPIIDSSQLYDLHEHSSAFLSKTFPRTHYNNQQQGSSHASSSNSGGTTNSGIQNTTASTAALLYGGSMSGSTLTTTTNLSSSSGVCGGTNGYPNDYGLPLVPGAELQTNHHLQIHPLQQLQQQLNHQQYSNSNSNSGSPHFISRTIPRLNECAVSATSSSSRGSPTPVHSSATHRILSNGQPINAKTIRVWQKGGVPVLPPVTALKRALISSSRNSPDEGYQEGCGTDV